MRIILMGPPGAGKGSEAELLSKHLNIPHISTGQIFRELYKDRTKVGRIAQSYIARGELVPDDITNEIVAHRLLKTDAKDGFLFDGFPRNIAQAEAFDAFLEKKGWSLDAVINIELSDDLIVKRISGRRVCETCGAVYHITNKKPKVEGICDLDGGKMIQRTDDMEETVKRRLKVYNDVTASVIGYYEKQQLLIHVDGSKTIQDTHEVVTKALGELK